MCGKPIGKGSSTYCSHRCFHDHRFEIKLSELDPNDLTKTFKSPQSIKKYILSISPNSCSICGLSDWMGGKIPLVLDHEDGNSDNNSIENLRLVCGNCNMNLPTFAGRNKNSGRHYRRQRYAEGKSS